MKISEFVTAVSVLVPAARYIEKTRRSFHFLVIDGVEESDPRELVSLEQVGGGDLSLFL
ncbi:MAG TPA: hypothetical protein VJB99_04670 [Patescibacteria group bacterium]|nr:hypothetical protein [Patescibacteria group bacterium]